MPDSNEAIPDAIAPSKPGLGCAGGAGATVRLTSRNFLSWLTSALRWRSLSSVAITLSSERASSAWLAGDGADAASAADAPEVAEAGAAALTVALLIRLCNAGMTGVPVPTAGPAAVACSGMAPTHSNSTAHSSAAIQLADLAGIDVRRRALS